MIEKVLDELYKKLPLDLNVIEINGIHPLSNGAVVVDVSYPMMSDDFQRKGRKKSIRQRFL